MHDLHSILLKIPHVLSTKFDNEVDINLKLSINLILYVICLPLLSCFLIGTEKVLYFFRIIPNIINFASKFFC